MDIKLIRERVEAGNYLIKSHAIQHALKEGFERKHIIEAVLNGAIIEEYADAHRVLINGLVTLFENISVHLHVICEYADPIYLEFVTAYIPDELEWERPEFSRRKAKR